MQAEGCVAGVQRLELLVWLVPIELDVCHTNKLKMTIESALEHQKAKKRLVHRSYGGRSAWPHYTGKQSDRTRRTRSTCSGTI